MSSPDEQTFQCERSPSCETSVYYSTCCDHNGNIRERPQSQFRVSWNSSTVPTLCRCRETRTTNHVSDGLLVTHLFLLCATIAAITLLIRRRLGDRRLRPREPPSTELPELHDYEARIALSLDSLVDVQPSSDHLATCCICLEPLGDSLPLARPPNCPHVTHKACITTWIDQATQEADKDNTDPRVLERILSCPICARPLVPEADLVYDDDLEASCHSPATP